MAFVYVPVAPVFADWRAMRTFREIGVQTEPMDSPVQPSSDALRMREYRKMRKIREEREMQEQCAMKEATLKAQARKSTSHSEDARTSACPDSKCFSCFNAGNEGTMAARLVPAVGGGWQVKFLRPVCDLELLEGGTAIAKQIKGLCAATRLRTRGDPLRYPTSFVPEYSIPLGNNALMNEAFMCEDMWLGCSPSLFPTPSPLGPHFTIDPQHTGTQRWSFTFPDTCARIDWCTMYVPPEKREAIASLHLEAASLLADGALGVPDPVATESKYLPVGWATLECGTGKANRPYVAPPPQERVVGVVTRRKRAAEEDAPVEEKLRLPYARAQASSLLPLLRRTSKWFGIVARLLQGGVDSDDEAAACHEDFFDFPPRAWQDTEDSQPHLRGHQVAFKLRGVPAECPVSVADRLPADAGLDVAAMHTDGYDEGLGTIIYLNHRAPAVEAHVGMPHADLVVASGRVGGRLARIQTFSPSHVVAIRMDFRNCVHGNVLLEAKSAVHGVSQLRVIHYSRVEIAKVTQFYRDNPDLSMLEGERKPYLLRERQSLGIE